MKEVIVDDPLLIHSLIKCVDNDLHFEFSQTLWQSRSIELTLDGT